VSGIAFIDAAELGRRLPMATAIDALEAAFRDGDPSATPLRSSVRTAAGSLLLMPATGPEGTGVKLVTITPDNPARGEPLIGAVYVLFDPSTQEPEAVFDGAALTALRTGAVSALATRWLARPDAHRLVLFGAGVQARAHLEAIVAVRPIEELVIVSRSDDRAAALAKLAQDRGLSSSLGDASSVVDADVICTCTTSGEPLFDGRMLAQGCHVNAVGAYTPLTRELDEATVRRAAVVVETREAAMTEAGDLLIPFGGPVGAGAVIVADLSEVVRGKAVEGDITVFESVGLAFEDLVVARAAVSAG
jgi:ornithine cyclodeaminase/alanine dehydrogenase-like protein (mu-crystallin family)